MPNALPDPDSLPCNGTINLGISVRAAGEAYPQPLDHFVCPEPVRKVYGRRPTTLQVRFPNNDEKSWLRLSYRCYSRARGLVCRGNGTTAIALVDHRTGRPPYRRNSPASIMTVPCHPATCPDYERRCRKVLTIYFSLPEVPGAGLWRLDTSSTLSIANITGALHLLKLTCGSLSAAPLLLRLFPRSVKVRGGNRTIHVLRLESALPLARVREEMARINTGEIDLDAGLYPAKEDESCPSC